MGGGFSTVGKESTCNAGDPGSIPGSGRCPGEGIGYPLQYSWASLVAQLAKNPPSLWETWVQSLGWEDPWRRERLPTPVFRPGEFHGLYSPWGRKELDTTEQLSLVHEGGAFIKETPQCLLTFCHVKTSEKTVSLNQEARDH